jgi:glycine hydroxymethyltransferase
VEATFKLQLAPEGETAERALEGTSLKKIDIGTDLRDLIEASRNHEKWRGQETVNLIASEGCPSPAVHEIYEASKDLWHRYAEGTNDLKGFPKERHYQGQTFMSAIERDVADLVESLFGADFADIRPISGTVANLATFKGLSTATHNSKMVVAPVNFGAHISHDYTGMAGQVVGLETIDHAFDMDEMNIDPDQSTKIIRAAKPGIVTFGGSLYLFPHPVREISDVAKEVGAYIVYDGAHVLGLLAGGEFQDPFKEGADFITGSTHKTFPGPQGGIILAQLRNRRGEIRKGKRVAAQAVQEGVFPLSVSNHHLRRLPALGLTAVEMWAFGRDYSRQIVRNAQKAGQYLCEKGLKVLGEKKGFTRSHQIAVDVKDHGGGRVVANNLEKANIIVNRNLMPYDDPSKTKNPSGLRVGFQEVTRRGFKESDIEDLCDIMLRVIKGEGPSYEKLRNQATELRKRFLSVEYGFNSVEEALDYFS